MRYIVLFFLITVPGWGTKYAGEPWSFGGHARYLGMGNTGVAFVSGPSALAWNVAGLAHPESGTELVLYHGSYFQGLHSVENIAFSRKGIMGPDLSTGIRLYLVQSTGIRATALPDPQDSIGEDNRPYVKEELAYRIGSLTVGTARNLGTWQWGVAVKLLFESLSVEQGYGLGMDAGIRYAFNGLALGLALRDLFTTPLFWTSGERELIWPSAVFGFAYEGTRGVLAIDLETHFENYGQAAAYAFGPVSWDLHVGGEWRPVDRIAVRAGLDRGNWTAGLGLRYQVWSLDYALLRHTDLEGSHRVSLSIRF